MSRDVQRDFFISYTSADSRWAEWIAWQLEEAGYSVVLQAWDFRPGAIFISEIERAIANAKRTLAVLSPQYLNALYTQPEWAAAFRRDPKGEQGLLVPVRVQECEVTGLLGQIIYVDLVEREEVAARKVLLAGVRHERTKPELAPAFPERIQHTVSKQLNFPGDQPSIWNVPYPRNSLFVGREQVLQDLHITLSTKHRAALTQLSTSDPGSIGATETAVEYAYRYQSDYSVILWIKADSRQILISDFISIASLLNLPEKSAQEQDHIVSAVKRWLQTQTNWLLVVDNVQDPELVKEFIPSPNKGHLLLTTRTQSMEALVPLVEMDRMKPEEQTLLLQLSRIVGATLRSSQRRMPLGLERVTIGRTQDNQVVLSDPSVSSHHAEIHLKEQGYWITDVGSTNGTFVNQQRLERQVPFLLHPGNTIRIGNTTFTYEVRDTPTGKLPVTPSPAPVSAPLAQSVLPTSARRTNLEDRVGQRLGNYHLTRLLGRGGFAEVYLGEHMYLDTQAAIKVLYTQLASDDIEHFRMEARTIARLVHPHIVRVLDFGVEGTTPFLVMDYAPNDTLRQRYSKGTRLPIETVVSYVKQIAPALQYAHNQKVIHRDIKPENMLVGRTGEVLLSDFGIALIAQSSRYQSSADMAGTIAYMAPEQIEAHPRPASDQYSLGIVVYEWLSGNRPFHGSFTEIAIKHSVVPPPSLCDQVPMLSPAVEQVVLTALAKDPKQRFATVQAFATALEQASQIRGSFNATFPLSQSPPPARMETTSEPASVEASEDALAPTISKISEPASRPTDNRQIINRLRRISKVKAAVLIVLALLLIGGSIGGSSFYFRSYNYLHRVSLLNASIPNPYPPKTGTSVLKDPLSDNSNGYFWYENSDSPGICAFTQRTYHVSMSEQGRFHYCTEGGSNFSNFAYEVQMTIVRGDGGGIIFRNDENLSNFYYFRIGQGGAYSLDLYTHKTSSRTLTNGTNSAIHTGLDHSNLIAVVANGSKIDLYVNKQHISSISDSTYSQGEIGLAAYDAGIPTEVVYSNATVWAL